MQKGVYHNLGTNDEKKTLKMTTTLTIDKAEPKRQPASALRGPYLSPRDANTIYKAGKQITMRI